jgi:DNA-binding transcriptional LysR family regulator
VAFGYEQLAPILSEFRHRHPALKLELLLTDSNLQLVNDRIDLAIRLGSQFDGDMICTKLKPTTYKICASPAYIDKHGAPRHPQDLTKHSCILLSLPEYRNQWHFRDGKNRTQAVDVSGEVIISNPLIQRRCAIEAMGPALLADWLSNEYIHNGQLTDLFPGYDVTATSFDTGVWLLYPSRNYLPAKVRAMIEFLRERLA